jgi:choline dehydrogenase
MASKEVILSAGAIGSPHLLMLSGVGSAEPLSKLGISVVVDNPAVGNNLQEHPGAWLTFRTRERTLNNEKSLGKQLIHGLKWLLFGRGPATTAGAQAVAFLRSTPAQQRPDLQLHFTPVGYTFSSSELIINDDPTVSVLPNVCRPMSRGRIFLRSSDSLVAPGIDMPLLEHPGDLALMTAGCRMVRHIMAQSAISELVLEETSPGKSVQTDADWEDYLRRIVVPCYHPVGTCKMGNAGQSVVDPELRVRGVENLRVADASIMPLIPSGNTNAAAIMIGEKASDLIRSRGGNN